MEEMERDLERLKLAEPPKWVKARAIMAAENVIARQARRTRYKCYAVAAVAAGVSVVAVGGYVADLIAPMMGKSGPSINLPAQPTATGLGDIPGGIMPIKSLSFGRAEPAEAERDAQEKAAGPAAKKDAAEDEKPEEAPGEEDSPSE